MTELSPYGDLLGYLRKIEPLFRQQGCTPDGVTQNTLQSWCSQIASGMEHLELKKVGSSIINVGKLVSDSSDLRTA